MFYPCIVSIHCPFIIRLIIVYPFVVNCLFMYLALISIYHPLIIHLLPIYHHILSCARPFVIDVLAIYFPCIFHSVIIVSSICHTYIVQYFFYCFHILSVSFHKVSHFRPSVQILSIVQPLYPAIIHLALCIIHVPSMLYPYKNTIPFLPIVHPCAIHRKSLLQDV